MAEDDSAYFQRRAEAETVLAEAATAPEVVRVHYQLAEAYFGKLATVAPFKAQAS